MLRCHDATNVSGRERKKKRERQSEKSQTVDITRYRIEGMYAWECINMWHAKINSSWALPNPNLPAHNRVQSKTHI